MFFFVILLIPLVLFIYVVKWKRKVIRQLGDPKIISSLINSYSPTNFLIKFIVCFLALGLMAFMGFYSKNFKKNDIIANGADIIIAIDVSNSMLCADVKPSRFIRAKLLVNKLIEKQDKNRFGLLAFAGKALLQMPITTDSAETKIIANSISPMYLYVPGTNIGAALQLANSSLNTKERRVKKIILITDGEIQDSLSTNTAGKLLNQNVSVYTVGVGTASGGPIIIDSSSSYITDSNGETVITKLNESLLKNISKITNGKYYTLDNENVVAENILLNINESYKIEDKSNPRSKFVALSSLIITIVLVLIIIELFISERSKNDS